MLERLVNTACVKNQSPEIFPKYSFWENGKVFGKIFGKKILRENFWEQSISRKRLLKLGGQGSIREVETMQRKNYKGRCEKRSLSKCRETFRSYSALQSVYADRLQADDDIEEIRCNVPLEGFTEGDYTTDFVCIRKDKDIMVRECVERRLLTKPKTVRLLEASRQYWKKHGVEDWGIVTDECK